jgi:hypothetical protein
MAYKPLSAKHEEHLMRFLNALNDGGGAEDVNAYLSTGGDVNAAIMPFIENTLLHHAAVNRRVDLIDLLVGRGADPNVCDAHGMTPMHAAIMHEMDAIRLQWQDADFPCARRLFRLGASPDIADKNGMTPRGYAGPPGTPMRDALDEALMDPND